MVTSTHDPKWHSTRGCGDGAGDGMLLQCHKCHMKWCSRECKRIHGTRHAVQCVKRCATSLAEPSDGSALLKCKRCRRTWYCGRECQKLGWCAGHKQTCVAKV
jgi:hypothetical protein